MEKNIFRQYFAYIAIAYIVIFIGVMGTVYFYYNTKIEKSFKDYNRAHEQQYDKFFDELAGELSSSAKIVSLEKIIDENNVVFMDIFDKADKLIFTKHKLDVKPPLFFNGNASTDNTNDYKLETLKNGYIFWFKITEIKNDTAYTVIGGVLLNAQLTQEINNTFDAAILSSTLTAIMLAIVIFPIIFFAYKELTRRKQKLLKSYIDTIEALGNAIAKRDSDTNSHNFRVTWYSIKIAEHIDLEVQKMPGLIMGSFLHDIGKIGIRDAILLKPDKLNDKEFEIMKTHVTQGSEILKNIEWLKDAKKVVMQHHERMDGKGYPKGLKGNEICIEAKIFAISDVFDALTSRRPYKEPISLEETFSIMQRESGTHFDSMLLEGFFSIAPELYQKASNADIDELKAMLGYEIERYFEIDLPQ